jgi:hypothetical protein
LLVGSTVVGIQVRMLLHSLGGHMSVAVEDTKTGEMFDVPVGDDDPPLGRVPPSLRVRGHALPTQRRVHPGQCRHRARGLGQRHGERIAYGVKLSGSLARVVRARLLQWMGAVRRAGSAVGRRWGTGPDTTGNNCTILG